MDAALDQLKGLRVTVMGLGRFGGGVGAARFLAQRGAHVTVTDLLAEDQLADSLAQLDDCPLAALHLGGHRDRDFREADLIVVNPAVPEESRFLALARRHGVPLTSEIALFWRFHRGRTLGVTGSNGKSTTAAMIHGILQAAGRPCRLGGNIGGSLLPVIDEIQPDEWCVLELSSFQLADLDRLRASPEVAVVTNFVPNHLDRHGTVENYRHAKQTILRWQSPEHLAVLNADDPEVSRWSTVGRRVSYGRLQGTPSDEIAAGLRVPGRHNLQNARAAATAAEAVGVPREAIRAGLENFAGLPHRLELVGEIRGRRYYNDSLATTPESAVAALESFTEPVVLLAGGSDKGADLGPLAERIVTRCRAVALMGQTAERLAGLIGGIAGEAPHGSGGPAFRRCPSFEEAFDWAVGQAQPGDVVLLSPGCASYDWFGNFADRGRRFTELVHRRL